MTCSNIHRSRAAVRGGFSLLEILVAVTLLAVIIVGLLAMFNQTQKAFHQGLTQTDVLEGGRAAMQLFSRELQQATAADRTNVVNLRASIAQKNPLSVTAADGTSAMNFLQELFFLTRYNDRWQAVQYGFMRSSFGEGVGTLYRSISNAPAANLYLLSQLSTNHVVDLDTNGFRPIIEGVVHFLVIPFDRLGFPILDADSNPDLTIRNDLFEFRHDDLPAYVDLELGILEPSALEHYRAVAKNPVRARAYLQEQAGKIHFFRQRIPIRTAP